MVRWGELQCAIDQVRLDQVAVDSHREELQKFYAKSPSLAQVEKELETQIQVQRKHVYNLRQSVLQGDSESCSEHIFQYMQAVVDEIIFKNVDPRKHPSNWNLGKLLDEFIGISERRLADLFAEITVEDFLSSLEQINGIWSITMDALSIPDLPIPPNPFRGLRQKNSSLKRWLVICSDVTLRKGRYGGAANLLRKYLGDFLIATYLEVVQDSGYDDTYVQEIERAVIVKTLDSFWRDHLINMNRLSSAVNVRSFGHRNPLEEYKIDGCRFFISMLSATRRLTVESLLQYWSSSAKVEVLE